MSLQGRGDGVEFLQRDEGGNVNPDMFRDRLHSAGFGLDLVEAPFADIDAIGQDAVDCGHAETSAKAGAIASFVQPGCDGLDAERAGNAVTDAVQSEYQPHGLSFDGILDETLFDALTARLAGFSGVAERNASPIVVALPGIFLHRAQDVLRVSTALVFVEERDHLAHHDLRGIVTELLGDRNQPDARLCKLADIHFERKAVAEEPRIRVHDDDVEGVIVVEAALDHALEFWPGIVGGGGAWLDELPEERPALGGAELGRLFALVRNGEIGFGLASGRDT